MNLDEVLHAVQSGSSEEIIEHFGVKGMKWGFRRVRERLARRKQRKVDAKVSKARTSQWKHKYAQRASISDRDLKRAVERLRLENDLAEQVKRTTKIHEKPKNNNSFAKDIGKTLVTDTIKDARHIATKEGVSYLKKNPDAVRTIAKSINTWMNT
jgi:hypothetical protein|nr:MAG TPA: Structural protein [Caudoviricetes sp.]